MSNWTLPDGIRLSDGIRGALLLGISNFGMVGGSLCAVEQNVTTAKECRQIGYLSYIMNSSLMAVGAFMLIIYCPEVLGDATPTVTIMSRYIAPQHPFITVMYYILMFMALITSAVPQAHAVISRVSRMVGGEKHEEMAAKVKTRFCVGSIYFVICIALSFWGLMAIVSKGYSFSAYIHIAVLAIPILLWYIRKLPAFSKKGGR